MSDEPALRTAARSGDLDAMADLGDLLVADYTVAQELGMPPSYRVRIDEGAAWLRRAAESGHLRALLLSAQFAAQRGQTNEEERWLTRAADSDDLQACERLWGFYVRQGRRAEAEACYRRMMPRKAEAGDPSAILQLAQQLAMGGRHDEAERWYDRLSYTPAFDWQQLGRELVEQGRVAEARPWYERAAATGDGHALASLGDFEDRCGDPAAAEERYLQAVRAGAEFATVRLGLLLERGERHEEAERWLRANPLGEADLLAFLERRGRTEDADRERRQQAQLRPLPPSPPEPVRNAPGSELTVAAAVVITAGVVPFLQALLARAAEDTYDGVRGLLRRLVASRGRRRAAQEQSSSLLVIEDPGRSGLKLHIRTDATDEALRALGDLEQIVDKADRPGARVAWDPATRTWRISER
ncbi:tetratricopeptide repeat protein [Micromonospora sp. BQ11]|uniref:tetratricopeptide repeat protein n=1 Tax=Micromonospora sp. BQ11 TaxID=3452212 RepID=UPI003F8B97EB